MTTLTRRVLLVAIGAVLFFAGYAVGVIEKPAQPLILPALADPTQLTVPFPERNGMVLCWSRGPHHILYAYYWVAVQQAERRCGK